jgi:hypothetical protein
MGSYQFISVDPISFGQIQILERAVEVDGAIFSLGSSQIGIRVVCKIRQI